jgi:lipoprotein NlpD
MRAAWLGLAILLGLVACADAPKRAPIVERASAKPSVPRAGARDAMPGHGEYRVKAGDTLYKIAFEHDLDPLLIARLNALDTPDVIHVGQILRLPTLAPDVKLAALPPASQSPVPRPLPSLEKGAVATKATTVTTTTTIDESQESELPWVWPARGRVITEFDPALGKKGIDIAGAPDTPIRAARPGRVVYAGSALRGYGKLTIIKHGPTLLTAYGHQSALRVAEGQSVGPGQIIGVMGDSDADRVKLHFEVREQGKPVDPRIYLPR